MFFGLYGCSHATQLIDWRSWASGWHWNLIRALKGGCKLIVTNMSKSLNPIGNYSRLRELGISITDLNMMNLFIYDRKDQ